MAEVGYRNMSGKTAMMIASYMCNSDAVGMLAPFEIGIVDNNGNTALMLSC